jgi:hypothetical protein
LVLQQLTRRRPYADILVQAHCDETAIDV